MNGIEQVHRYQLHFEATCRLSNSPPKQVVQTCCTHAGRAEDPYLASRARANWQFHWRSWRENRSDKRESVYTVYSHPWHTLSSIHVDCRSITVDSLNHNSSASHRTWLDTNKLLVRFQVSKCEFFFQVIVVLQNKFILFLKKKNNLNSSPISKIIQF